MGTIADTYTLGKSGAAYIGAANREDLLDVVTLLSPTDTPLFTMFRKTKARNVETSWLTDSLDIAASNAVIEGSAVAFRTVNPRIRLTTYQQISRQAYEVTDTQRAVDPAGVQDELLYTMGKAAKQWKRDVEYEIINASALSGTSAIARQIQGMYQILSVGTMPGGTNLSGNSSGVTGANTAANLQEADVNARLQALWVSGGLADYIICTPTQKNAISSNFAGSANSRRNMPAMDNVVNNVVDYYNSDFGNVKVLPHRWFHTAATGTNNVQRATFFIQSDMWMIGILRPPKNIPLAKVTSTERAMIEGEWTLICRHPSANAVLTGHAAGSNNYGT